MANPDNALGTNGAFGGRTSVNAFNDVLSTFNGRGILSGWECVPDSGLIVKLGGVNGVRDVAIAEDPGGNKTTVNNISQAPVSVTLPAAPASNSRVDSIVAYIESSPSSDAVLDNPDAVNLLVVSGSTATSPVEPTDSQIRTAITGDGASGATAYYVVLANVTMAAGTTDVDATMISAGAETMLASGKINILAMWPVGSYYETSNTTFDPNVAWGGTWVKDNAGRVTVSQNSGTFSVVGRTGGEERHTLTVNEMPSHSHTFQAGLIFAGSGSDGTALSSSRFDLRDSRHILSTGGNASHNNLQPYVVVVRWHRTS